jgi:hypothetical protein
MTLIILLAVGGVLLLAGAVWLKGIPRGRAKTPFVEEDAEEICAANARPLTTSILEYSDGRPTRHVK